MTEQMKYESVTVRRFDREEVSLRITKYLPLTEGITIVHARRCAKRVVWPRFFIQGSYPL